MLGSWYSFLLLLLEEDEDDKARRAFESRTFRMPFLDIAKDEDAADTDT